MTKFNPALFWARSALRVANKTGVNKSRAMTALNKARSTGAERLSIDAKITIDGIPVGVHVDSYYPGTNRLITSASLEPNDEPEIEYTITNLRGYPLGQWMVDKFPADLDSIVMEALRDGQEY